MSEKHDQGGLLVVIPTYDEVENIAPLVRRIHASLPAANILIVDDGSPDGTGDVADALAAADSQARIFVIHRPDKLGLGSAYMQGFRWGLDHDSYALFAQLDADGSHAPEQLSDLISAIDQGADFAIGSRYSSGGSTSQWNSARLKLSQLSNLYAQQLLATKLKDLTSGFRVYTREAIASGALGEVRSTSFCFQVEMTFRLIERGFTPTEVPIVFRERKYGQSKMTSAMVWEGFVLVSELGFRKRFQHTIIHLPCCSPRREGTRSRSSDDSRPRP
ncbi:polyprenol monophosphomannose synthase [Rhodococcus cerastii]|nr:polyprenol monophosphomannose synthase [Rhodococcus cerastii]